MEDLVVQVVVAVVGTLYALRQTLDGAQWIRRRNGNGGGDIEKVVRQLVDQMKEMCERLEERPCLRIRKKQKV